MDFYLRAREGDMRQFNKDGELKTPISPPTLTPVSVSPKYIDTSFGFKMKEDMCKLKTQWYFESLAATAKGKNGTAKATATFDAPKGLQFGYKVAAVTNEKRCKNPNCKNCALTKVNDERLQVGCLWFGQNGAPILNRPDFSGTAKVPKDPKIQQLCEMDRSLSEAGSMFFSPYKQQPQKNNGQKISNTP